MSIPLLILVEIGSSKLLQIIYLLPIIWSSLLVSSYLVVWLLRYSIKSRAVVFLVLYLVEGSIATLVSTIAYLPSLLEKQILGIIILTALLYSASYSIIRFTKRKADNTVPGGVYSANLTEMVHRTLGRDDGNIPSVFLSELMVRPDRKIYTVRREKKIFLLDSFAKMLSPEEMKALLAYSIYKYFHNEDVKMIYLIATFFAFEADIFAYVMMGGFPNFGVIILPVVGILMFVEIIFSPVIVGIIAVNQKGSADRYAAKVTGDPAAVASLLHKLEGSDIQITSISGRSGKLLSWFIHRSRNRRLSNLSKKQ
ncbi:MAG: hypothetical protein QW597_02930 [Thermoplasmataceae archaeon]